jgi:hypothetical protein
LAHFQAGPSFGAGPGEAESGAIEIQFGAIALHFDATAAAPIISKTVTLSMIDANSGGSLVSRSRELWLVSFWRHSAGFARAARSCRPDPAT